MEEKLPEKLIENLDPDEKILYAVKKKIGLEKPKWLVVTNRRLIVFDEKILGRYEMKAIPYERVEKIHLHIGAMASEFIIELEKGEKIILTWMNREESREAVNAIYNALKSLAVEPPVLEKKKGVVGEDWILHKSKELLVRSIGQQRQLQTLEIESLLKQLEELRNKGVLTEDEYREKVKKILEKI